MTNIFYPGFRGTYKPEGLSPNILANFASRIESSGLFPMASKRRNQYKIVEKTDHSLRFRAMGLLTAINIGLNDVFLQIDKLKGEIHYKVTYWTWAKYCIFLGIIIGFFLVAGLFIFPANWYPPEKIMKTIFWPFLGFWCLIWPWILIAIHKGPANKCLLRILDEVNSSL